MILTLVPPPAINTVWLKILPYVRDLVTEAEGRVTEMMIYEEFCKGDQLLWIATDKELNIKGFLSTKVNQYPASRMAAIDYCAGVDSEEWGLQLMEVIERWAKDCECDGIEVMWGRKGWMRKFKNHGFTERFVWGVKRFKKE